MISNPLVSSYKLVIERDDEKIELNRESVCKYFWHVYILCPMKNVPIVDDIYKSRISEKSFEQLSNKMILFKTNCCGLMIIMFIMHNFVYIGQQNRGRRLAFYP